MCLGLWLELILLKITTLDHTLTRKNSEVENRSLQKKKKKKKLYFVMVTMSRLNRDFQWAIRDKQSLLRARYSVGKHFLSRHIGASACDFISVVL